MMMPMAAQTPTAAVMHVPTQPPPIVHAISGSIGSAVALLLLYPLERVRIELQRNAATSSNTNAVHHSVTTIPEKINCTKIDLRCPESFELVEEQEDAEMLQESVVSKASSDATSLVRCIQDLWVKKSLYRGVMHNCISLSISNFCFFFVNEYVKKHLVTMQQHRKGTATLRPEEYLLASCIAGICNVLVTNPLWVSNLQIVTEDDVEEGGTSQRGDQSTGVVSRLVHIARTQGVAHLWSGTSVSLLLVSNPVIQFFVYEQLKQRILAKGPLRVFFMAAVAKFISTVLTYPLQLSQTALRLTDESHPDNNHNTTILSCLRTIYRKGGPAALFTGMRPKLLQTVLTAACTFLTYEQIVAALHGSILRQQQLALLRV